MPPPEKKSIPGFTFTGRFFKTKKTRPSAAFELASWMNVPQKARPMKEPP